MNLRTIRAEWIVAGALNIKDPIARRAHLDSACAGNEPLRQEVEALLGNRQPGIDARREEAPPPLATQAGDSRTTRRHPVLIGLAVVLLALVVGVGVSKLFLGSNLNRAASPQNPEDALAAGGGVTNLPISLAAWTNAPHDKGWVPPMTPERIEGNGLLGLDPGRHVLGGIAFDVQGLIQLSSLAMRDERHADFPERVEGIKVGTRCDRLGFLQACIWDVRDGTEVGHYVVHFADGEKLEVPIVFGVDLRDWQSWTVAAIGGPADATMAWKGTNIMAPIRLYQMAWDNPRDGVAVDRIDYVSAMTRSAPFLVAVTAQQFSPAAPEFWLGCARALELQGKNAEALVQLEQGTVRLPGSIALWTKLGTAQQEAGQSEEAYRTFCRAILLAETNAMVLPADRKKALLARCDFLRRQERYVEAATDYRASHDLALSWFDVDGRQTNSLADYHLAASVMVLLGTTNLEEGLELTDWPDGQTGAAQWDGQDCRTLSSDLIERYAYFRIDPTFKFTCASNVLVEVEYFDVGRGIFGVHFDGGGRDYRLANPSMPLRNSQRWLTARFRLTNVRFENSQNAQADFRVWARGGPLSVSRVTVIPERSLPKTAITTGANRSKPPMLAPIPPRDPRAGPGLIDLSMFYNGGLNGNWRGDNDPENGLASLPTGIQTLAGTTFDVRGLIQIASNSQSFPASVPGIPVSRRCQRLHFLHNAIWGFGKPGTRIGQYVMHYVDGQTREQPIVLGEDILDFWKPASETISHPKLVVAWEGANGFSIRSGRKIWLFKTTWENPRPAVEIKTIDFQSVHEKIYPFLIAITAD